jgi:3-hydroxyisobutyrate dehydrogenase-like beta-hydroxyacid dehydrogenase/ketosteroid isomerase-like protein
MSDDRGRVAFVGAGEMGLPMVRRLVAAGHEVVVHARRPDRRAVCEAAGASATGDLRVAVAGAHAVLVCVYSDDQVLDVALGSDGLLSVMDEGALLVVHTTGSPATARRIADEGAARHIRVVEAPISGSAADIDAGRLTVMLAGSPDDVHAARSILDAYGGAVFDLGALGAAQAVKLLNNALLAANLQLVAEVERILDELAIDPTLATEVIQSSSGASRAMGIAHSAGSAQALMAAAGRFLVKDVSEVVATAEALGLDLGQLESVIKGGPLTFQQAGDGEGEATAVDQDLREIEAIKQLKARYFRLLDTKDWDGFADLFTDDCQHLLPTDDPRPLVPNAQYLVDIRRTLEHAITVHHGHMPEIELTGPGEAKGTWAMTDDVEIPREGEPPMRLKGAGHYHETYRKCDDGKWRISSKRNIRLRVDHLSP